MNEAHYGIRVCDWCHRWEREGGWVTRGLDDTAAGVLIHAVCPDCAAGVVRGDTRGVRHPSAAETDRLLRLGGELEQQVEELRGHRAPKGNRW
jgi:hypothetical protein